MSVSKTQTKQLSAMSKTSWIIVSDAKIAVFYKTTNFIPRITQIFKSSVRLTQP
jgi:hypothetical protein